MVAGVLSAATVASESNGGGGGKVDDSVAASRQQHADSERAEAWIPVCRLEHIAPLGARRVELLGPVPIAVFRAGGDAVFALVDRCPHKGGPLSQGIVFAQGVACPLHNWTIGLADGCAAAPDQGCTPRIDARVDDGVVQLHRAQLAAVQAADGAPASPGAPGA